MSVNLSLARWPRLAHWLFAALCLFALPSLAMAQGTPQFLTAADQAEIVQFKLDEDVLARLQALIVEGKTMQIKKAAADMSQVHSLDDMARQMVAGDPRIAPLMQKHGFTPHRFLVVNMALVNAAMVAGMQADPQLAKQVDPAKVNMDNVRFYQDHAAAIDQLMRGG